MLKKIGFGAGLWAIMFLGVSALMVTPMSAWLFVILEIVLAGVAGYVLGMLYFKKDPTDIKGGVITAAIWLAVTTVLDLALTVQFTRGGGSYFDGFKNFYGQWSLWVSFVVMVVAVAMAAKMTHGGELMQKPVAQPPMSKPVMPPKRPPTPPQQPPSSPSQGSPMQ